MRSAAPLLALLLSLPALADGDPEVGKPLFEPCQACHGVDGAGSATSGAPRIAGQRADYLVRQLTNFQTNTRQNDKMHTMAATLQDRLAVKNVVAYIGTLQSPTPPDKITGDVAAGQTTWALCMQCHGSRGEGSSVQDTPKLAGQHDWYLKKQLESFRKGTRGDDSTDRYGATMKHVADGLDKPSDILNVIAWINTLE